MGALVGLARRHAGRTQTFEIAAQVGRRFDVVARIVGRRIQDDERGGPRDQAEALADALDLGTVQVVFGFQRRGLDAAPALRGEGAMGCTALHRHDHTRNAARAILDAQDHAPLRFGQAAGEHQPPRVGKRRGEQHIHDALDAFNPGARRRMRELTRGRLCRLRHNIDQAPPGALRQRT